MRQPKDPTKWPTVAQWAKTLALDPDLGLAPMWTLSRFRQLHHAKAVGAVMVGPWYRVPPGAKDPRQRAGRPRP